MERDLREGSTYHHSYWKVEHMDMIHWCSGEGEDEEATSDWR